MSTFTQEGFFTASVADTDPELQASLTGELERQQNQIELIASENIVSKAVMEAQGSVLTNKYAEGYPGRRYYQGCHHVDIAESLAIERAKKALQRGLCQCATTLWRASQWRRNVGPDKAG